jgi:ubiquinone/menaquinone biosynthesis C-methylase UbiE
MQRMPSIELLDEDQGDPRDIQTSFDDLWRINRWLGGVSGSMRLFNRFFRRTGSHPVRILDVGAGDGRMTDYLGRWLRQRYPGAQMVALDRRLSHLQNGRPADRDLRGIVADVRALPFSPESFEIVTCNLFLHHFSGAAAIELLRAMLRSAREAVLINDLDRKWLPYWIVGHAPWIARSPITRSDGPASVRQAYTRRELRALAAESGSARVEMIPLHFFRSGMILWKRCSAGL